MHSRMRTIAAGVAIAAFAGGALGQDRIAVKVAYFAPPQHLMSQWLTGWGQKLEKDSGGRLAFSFFPGAQMGPAPSHYDLARSGQADVTWFLHGGTPGRFPLTELLTLPYMVASAEMGTQTLNDPVLRSRFLDAEHRGIKPLLLFASTPVNLFTTKKAVRTPEDFKGLRIRFASAPTRAFIAALGGTPVGVSPTEQLEQLQKGGLDGVFTDYGGAGTAFKMGGTVKYATEIYCCVVTFGIAMNEAFYDRLPPDLKRLVERSVTGVERDVGKVFDDLDAVGKNLIVGAGGEAIRPAREHAARLRKVSDQVHESILAELAAKNPAAREAYQLMKDLAQKHAARSRSFWSD